MEKDRIEYVNSNQIILNERKSINLSGVKKIESFDDEEFLMETNLGFLIIKGENLEIIKLDTYQGNVSIKGLITSLNYVEENSKNNSKEGLLTKLFK